jgi:hypothetical protein
MNPMLRHVLLFGIVVVANGLALATVARNASGVPEAVVTLTEREARLVDVDAENTGMLLSLQWDGRLFQTRPAWFTAARLASVGFDCSVDPASKDADRHYRSPAFLPRPAFVAVTVLPNAPQDDRVRPDQVPWDRARAAGGGALSRTEQERQRASRLSVIDVGTNVAALRQAHPDRQTVFITRGVVRLEFVPASADGPARLEGRVLRVEPGVLWVPRDRRAAVTSLSPAPERTTDLALEHDPRYEVKVQYGRDLLPSIVDVKPLR